MPTLKSAVDRTPVQRAVPVDPGCHERDPHHFGNESCRASWSSGPRRYTVTAATADRPTARGRTNDAFECTTRASPSCDRPKIGLRRSFPRKSRQFLDTRIWAPRAVLERIAPVRPRRWSDSPHLCRHWWSESHHLSSRPGCSGTRSPCRRGQPVFRMFRVLRRHLRASHQTVRCWSDRAG